MSNFSTIPFPFLFNDIKHHRASQIDFIDGAIQNLLSVDQVKERLLKIGNSMIDLYYGKLPVRQICEEITMQLQSKEYYRRDDYLRFLNKTVKKFRKLHLSDGTSWTLLIGREEERYIHIHPSRASRHTIRVRAIALKTAIMLLIYYKEDDLERDLVNQVNEIRENYMEESPIKNVSYTKGLRRALRLLTSSIADYTPLQSRK